MSCRHAKKEIQALSGACLRILATEKGTSPWLSSPAIYAPSLSCSRPSTGTKRSGASLIGETAMTLRPLAPFPRHFSAFARTSARAAASYGGVDSWAWQRPYWAVSIKAENQFSIVAPGSASR